MLSLGTAFWLMVTFFALIGTLRGWTKEIIATSGLVLSLFALNQFGAYLVSLLGVAADPTQPGFDPMVVQRQQFYVLTVVHLIITFFSYQGPTLAGARLSERLRVRDSLQDKVLGAIVGAVNGYLIVGTIWAFLEYNVVDAGIWQALDPTSGYPFDPATMTRPTIEMGLASIIEKLPLPALSPYLPFLVVIVFLFVIIVMI